jgi:hypothetical protein
MQATHKDAEERYAELRREVRAAVERQLPYPDRPKISLRGIDGEALNHAEAWRLQPERQVDWPWSSGFPLVRFRYPKRFDLAIWYEKELAGLSFGRPSYNGTFLRLDFAEASPRGSPLKGRIFPITLTAAELYAHVIGAHEVRLVNPIHESLVEYYSRFGYTYVSGRDHYLYKRFL